MIEIAIPRGTAFFTARVELDGTTYLIDFSWNARAACWYAALHDAAGVALVAGLALVSNWPLLRRYHHVAGVPAGELMAIDPTDTIAAANYDQLGQEVSVAYLTRAEIDAGLA